MAYPEVFDGYFYIPNLNLQIKCVWGLSLKLQGMQWETKFKNLCSRRLHAFRRQSIENILDTKLSLQ
jgi:hypothetical protein